MNELNSNVGGLKQGSFENTGSASLMVRPVLGAALSGAINLFTNRAPR